MPDKQYYMMLDGRRHGPLPADQLAKNGAVPSTPIWCDGMEDWVPASQVDAVVATLPRSSEPPAYRGHSPAHNSPTPASPPAAAVDPSQGTRYYLCIDGNRTGPFTPAELSAKGATPQTLVWNRGMPNWLPAERVPELAAVLPQPPVSAWRYVPSGNTEPVPSPQMPAKSSGKFAIGIAIGIVTATALFGRRYVWPRAGDWAFDEYLPLSHAWSLTLLALVLHARWKHPSMAKGYRLGIAIVLVAMLALAGRFVT